MKIILDFTLPIFIGNVFQQFYNMADAVIVGKFVGTRALAAVGSTGTIMFLIYGFVVGMTAGFTVLTAQKFGAGDMSAMRRTVAGASILSLIIGADPDGSFMILMKPWLTGDEHAVGYICGRLCIYHDHQRRHSCTDAL